MTDAVSAPRTEPKPLALGLPPSAASDAPAAACCSDGCCTPTAGRPPAGDAAWLESARWAKRLAWASLVWMTVEGVLGLLAGVAAGSVALVGWALGSAIEGLASVIVVWRFTGSRTLSEHAERRAQRAVAVSFWLLAPYIAVQAIRDLATGQHAQSSALGIAVTATSLLVMPALGVAKQRLGRQLDSGATAAEGVQNYLCAAQAAAVLLGLAVLAVWPGAGWVDPVVALAIAGWSVWEGGTAWRGQDCC